MALYHLDPRQAASGAAPDCQTTLRRVSGPSFLWTVTRLSRYFDTEAEALAAAREAAGFGHVAEQPCGGDFKCRIHGSIYHDPCDCTECKECAWPRAAHQVTP